jgi:hypothetical protein
MRKGFHYRVHMRLWEIMRLSYRSMTGLFKRTSTGFSAIIRQNRPIQTASATRLITGVFFAGLVDGTNGTGHKAPTTYGRNANLFLADLRPDKYYDLVSPELTSGGTTTSMDTFSRFIWAKSQRQTEGYSIGFSPAPGPSTAAQNCHAVDVHERGIDSLHHQWQHTVCNNRHALYRSGHG